MKTVRQSEAMKKIQPEMEKIEKKYKNKTDNDSLMAKSQETMMLYKKYKINPVGSCLTAFIQLTRKEIKEDEDEKPEQLIIEKPKKKIETDPLDVDGPPGGEEEKPEEEQPPEEENPDGVPKFKPENFSWTSYDGKPRNYVQILKRLKGFPIEVIDSGNCREQLVKMIGKHMDNYLEKEKNKYKGLISIIKIAENVPCENEDEIKRVSLAIGERKGIKEN